MDDYKGIKINDEVIIVERLNNKMNLDIDVDENIINQGYIVDINNSKMLKTALIWGKIYAYSHTDSRISKAIDAIQHRYKNGTFTFEVLDSPDESSQGGKLSFWNCKITDEENKSYLIGINSDILCELLKNNTFVNGKCDKKVWLGRVKGNKVGAFTENMSLFTQAKLDAELRNSKSTTNYQPGQRVRTKNTDCVYVGEVYKVFDLVKLHKDKYNRYISEREYSRNYYSCIDYTNQYALIVEDSLLKKYVYIINSRYYKKDGPDYLEDEKGHLVCQKYFHLNVEDKKLSRIVTSDKYKVYSAATSIKQADKLRQECNLERLNHNIYKQEELTKMVAEVNSKKLLWDYQYIDVADVDEFLKDKETTEAKIQFYSKIVDELNPSLMEKIEMVLSRTEYEKLINEN